MYRTEPPTDKTIREWHMKFQQSGCLCAAKRRGRPGPVAPADLFVTKKIWEILYQLICSFLSCLSWLLRSRIRKFRRDLWITLY